MRFLIILAVIFSLTYSCGEKRTYIPDEEFGEILMQSVIADAFNKNTNQMPPQLDSISIFLPILDEYGYTYEDVDYTIERMAKRKSNVFKQLMVDVMEDVEHLKAKYEYESSMGRNWRARVKNEIYDTLYFSPDTMRIKSLADVQKLNYRFSLNEPGDVIVKFNYRIMQQDSNSSRYALFAFRDSLSDKEFVGASHWLGKSNKITKFNREITHRDSRLRNQFDLRLLSYTANRNFHTDNPLKSIDVYFDSLTVLFRPLYEEGDRILRRRLAPQLTTFWSLEHGNEKPQEYTVPMDTIHGNKRVYTLDSVQYTRVLDTVRFKPKPPVVKKDTVINKKNSSSRNIRKDGERKKN